MVTFGRLQQSSCELSCTNEFFFVGGGPPVGNVGSNGGGHLMDLAGTYDAKPDKVCPPPYSTLQANICAHYVAQREVA